MRIFPSKQFEKMFKKCSQEAQYKCIERLKLFEVDKYNSLLNNHSLSGKLHGLRSVNISGDYRLIFEEKGEDIILIAIGTHSQLYK